MATSEAMTDTEAVIAADATAIVRDEWNGGAVSMVATEAATVTAAMTAIAGVASRRRRHRADCQHGAQRDCRQDCR